MSRPGKPLTKKSILLQTKMAELEKGDKCSNSLLANVLDMDDDFIAGSLLGENALSLQAAALGLATNKQPRSNAWLDVDHTRWSFPYKVGVKQVLIVLRQILKLDQYAFPYGTNSTNIIRNSYLLP